MLAQLAPGDLTNSQLCIIFNQWGSLLLGSGVPSVNFLPSTKYRVLRL